jgi:hypothetical protein
MAAYFDPTLERTIRMQFMSLFYPKPGEEREEGVEEIADFENADVITPHTE